MQIKRFSIAVMLGVILSMVGAGSATAQGYFIEVKRYCNGVESFACQVGQEVTVTATREVDGQMQPVNADWDPDGNSSNFHPEQFNTPTFRYVYQTPGVKNVTMRASDGSGSGRETGIEISDPDGRPDPTLEPAFTKSKSSLRVSREGSICQVTRTMFFRSYRDYNYSGRLEAKYRFRSESRKGQRSQLKLGRVALVKRGPVVSPASYDFQVRRISWSFNMQSTRIKRLIKRRATISLSLRQRVLHGSTVVSNETGGKRRFSLKLCR